MYIEFDLFHLQEQKEYLKIYPLNQDYMDQ
jgi:hypothetical protein